MTGRKSRNKGKSGEREAAKELSRLFGVECRRSQQYNGLGDGDVSGLPGIHCESKRTERLNLYDAIEQAVRDANEGDVPMVVHRRNNKPWVAIVKLDNLPELVSKLYLTLASEGE